MILYMLPKIMLHVPNSVVQWVRPLTKCLYVCKSSVQIPLRFMIFTSPKILKTNFIVYLFVIVYFFFYANYYKYKTSKAVKIFLVLFSTVISIYMSHIIKSSYLAFRIVQYVYFVDYCYQNILNADVYSSPVQ